MWTEQGFNRVRKGKQRMSIYRIFLWGGLTGALLYSAIAAGDAQPQTLQQLQDFYPRVNDSVNAALVYQQAAEKRAEPGYDEDLPLFNMSKAPSIQVRPVDSKVKAAITRELERNMATLQLLHVASTKPQCRFPVDLTKGQSVELPHLARLRDFARLLELQAINAADDQNPELAVQSVVDSMAVAQSLRKEPLIVSQKARITFWQITLDALNQIVNRVPLDDQSLSLFQESIAKADDREAITRAFQGELCMVMNVKIESAKKRSAREKAKAKYAEDWEKQNKILSDAVKNEVFESNENNNGKVSDNEVVKEKSIDANAEKLDYTKLPEPISAIDDQDSCPKMLPQEKLEMIRKCKLYVEESMLPYIKLMTLFPPPIGPEKKRTAQYAEIAAKPSQIEPAVLRTLVSVARLAGNAIAAHGAMAVERYRLRNSKLPVKWEDMIPEFIAAPIQDPFTEEAALKLKVSGDNYIIYSIGPNGVDDGGTEGDGRPPLDHIFRVDRSVSAGKESQGGVSQ